MKRKLFEWCIHPAQCPLQHVCQRNLANHEGSEPPVRIYRKFVRPPDGRCPGFLNEPDGVTAALDL